MKKEGRTKLFCRKTLRNGISDMFSVIVMTKEKDSAKKMYKDMGYDVSDKG